MSDESGEHQVNGAYTIGAILRGAREASGESIEDVSRILRINWRYLQALEEGQFEDLPGSAYAIGFIRTYASRLGVDSADLIDQYKALGEATRSKTALEFPEPIPESGLPGGAILFAGIIVAVLAYGGWYLATEEDSFLAEMVSPVPEHLAESTEEDAVGTASTEDAAVPQPAVVEESAPELEQASEQLAETVEAVEEEAEAVAETVSDATEERNTAAEEVAEQVSVQPVEEAVEAVSSVDAQEEPEAETVAEVEQATESAVSDDDAARELNEAQLKALQASMSDEDTVSTETASDSPEEVVETPEPEAESETVAEAEPELEQASEDEAVESAESESAEAEEQAAAADTDSPEAETPAGRVFGDEGAARIVVRAKTNSWIQVRDDTSGQLLLTRMLRTGDEYHVPDRTGLSLLTGNAGALDIMVDGESVPPLGATGDVRRNVALDADRLISGAAATE